MDAPLPDEAPLPPVLLVDGDLGALAQLGTLIQSGGFAVLGADGAEMALGLARVSRPALVISEARLPDHDVLWLLEQLRRRVPGTDVLVLAQQLTPSERAELERCGASHCLLKPPEARVLLARVEGALVRRQLDRAWPRQADSANARLAALRALLSGRNRQIQKPAPLVRRKPFLPN